MSDWPNDPNGSLVPILEASVTAAQQRHPSASGDRPGKVLTAVDRCDRCPAAAVYQVTGVGGALEFCLHHWRKHFPDMAKTGWQVTGANPELAAAIGSEGQ
jgi:hypothetical protein